MDINFAQEKDLETVRSITQTTIKEIYPKYYPAGAVDFFIRHHSDDRIASDIKKGRVYILTDEGQKVGTVTIEDNHIFRLFVLPKYQGKGYGRALMDHAEKKAFENSDTIVLDSSLPAKKIYMKRGFKETEYHVIDTGNGDFLCYDVMEKHK
ncbi:MAG: GNAT family N-acetyltransferase [Clostridia bacterium]|nr:GNAT family N-acetyltransferase [Clostridia bacterium]